MSIFNLYQLNDHVSCWRQALVKHTLHDIADPKFKSLKSVDVVEVYTAHDVSQFFVYFVCTLKRRLKKPSYLLSH